jgi:hypothetical protein
LIMGRANRITSEGILTLSSRPSSPNNHSGHDRDRTRAEFTFNSTANAFIGPAGKQQWFGAGVWDQPVRASTKDCRACNASEQNLEAAAVARMCKLRFEHIQAQLLGLGRGPQI